MPLVFSFKNHKLLAFFLLGSSIGLLHLLNVWYLIGHARVNSNFYIDMYSVNIWGVVLSLSTGFSEPMGWETWAAIGIPMICLFRLVFAKSANTVVPKGHKTISPQNIALLVSILLLLATGIAYRGNDLFDLFRVPARALAFIALAIILYVFVNLGRIATDRFLKQQTISLLIFASTIQVVALAWLIRPAGSPHSPYEKSVQSLAEILKADEAKSVWFSTKELYQMYIDVGLTRNNLALPNVYYGDMGQEVEITGEHCGTLLTTS